MVDNVSYVQGPAQALVIIHHPHISTASLSKGWGFRGTYRPTCFAASTLSLWVLRGGEGHGHLVYKYTWSIGNCATWCHIPVPSSCRSLVSFKPLVVSWSGAVSAVPLVYVFWDVCYFSFGSTCLIF